MTIELLLVGKTNQPWLVAGMREYEQRLKHYVRFNSTVIPELKNARNLTDDQIREKEGELILSRLGPSDRLVLLDEHGKQFSSTGMAEWLQKNMNRGWKRMVFVVGGAYGFSEKVYARAEEKLSLSPMTFSHQMVRVIFTEQLYRAFTILKGEPYHHN